MLLTVLLQILNQQAMDSSTSLEAKYCNVKKDVLQQIYIHENKYSSFGM